MSPRLVEGDRCPHCGAAVATPKPRVCPQCAGSLQQRYLKAGCLSSAPKLLLFAFAAAWLVREWFE
jgi:predicted amidophosphoribosyltransferase